MEPRKAHQVQLSVYDGVKVMRTQLRLFDAREPK